MSPKNGVLVFLICFFVSASVNATGVDPDALSKIDTYLEDLSQITVCIEPSLESVETICTDISELIRILPNRAEEIRSVVRAAVVDFAKHNDVLVSQRGLLRSREHFVDALRAADIELGCFGNEGFNSRVSLGSKLTQNNAPQTPGLDYVAGKPGAQRASCTPDASMPLGPNVISHAMHGLSIGHGAIKWMRPDTNPNQEFNPFAGTELQQVYETALNNCRQTSQKPKDARSRFAPVTPGGESDRDSCDPSTMSCGVPEGSRQETNDKPDSGHNEDTETSLPRNDQDSQGAEKNEKKERPLWDKQTSKDVTTILVTAAGGMIGHVLSGGGLLVVGLVAAGSAAVGIWLHGIIDQNYKDPSRIESDSVRSNSCEALAFAMARLEMTFCNNRILPKNDFVSATVLSGFGKTSDFCTVKTHETEQTFTECELRGGIMQCDANQVCGCSARTVSVDILANSKKRLCLDGRIMCNQDDFDGPFIEVDYEANDVNPKPSKSRKPGSVRP